MKRNPQNGKYWFKGELQKCMTTVFLPASIWGHIIGTSSAFVKKRIGLLFTDGNIWPSKISNGPKINAEGGQTLPSKFVTWGQH